MGHDRHKAVAPDHVELAGDLVGQLVKVELDQKVSGACKRHQKLLLEQRLHLAAHQNLGPGGQTQGDLPLLQRGLELAEAGLKLLRAVVLAPVAGVAVRRCHNELHPALGGHGSHAQGGVHRGRTVVHAGQQVTMQVDHSIPPYIIIIQFIITYFSVGFNI